MNTIELLTPILEGGIRNTNFFNGRFLTAEDLKTEQQANRQQHQQLGQAIGEGVVDGMEVSIVSDGSNGETSTLSISKGLALNRKGQALFLPNDVKVALARTSETVSSSAGLFADCKPPESTAVPTGTGVYVLVASPALEYEGSAPMSGPGANGKITGCGSRYAVEGVQFRLEKLEPNSVSGASETTRNLISQLMTKSDAASLSKLRNMLAHLCFGTEKLARLPQDPFRSVNGESTYTTYGALDAMRSLSDLTDCDVPLALIYWTTSGIQFVDIWSVRRRPVPKSPSATQLLLSSERPLVEAEAALLQFQEQVEELIFTRLTFSESVLVKATDYFSYLPPIGFLPVQRASQRGVDVDTFFSQQPHRKPEFIDGALVYSLLRESMKHEPIDVSEKEMVWVYKVWQNEWSIKQGEDTQPFIIFTSPHIPYAVTALFDVAHWDYSNYTRL